MTRAYFNERAGAWDGTASERDAGKLRAMAKRLGLSPGMTVLDVGTGTGVFLPYLLDEIGGEGRVVALDYSEGMLRRARLKLDAPNVDYLQADALALPLTDSSLDAVVCYSSFPHFADKRKALAGMAGALRRGGRLYICHTSNREEINHIHREILLLANDTLPASREMGSLLRGAGFLCVRVEEGTADYLASGIRA